MPTVYGVNASPFVRKVRVALAEKGVAYDLDPVIPVNVSAEYRRISPLGKIPAYRDERVTLADSSVICAYLERIHPQPSLYPSDPVEYARALWFEEYGDGGLSPVVGPKIFFPRVVGPRFFQRPSDEAAVQKAIDEELPPFFDYLESQLGDAPMIVGTRFSIGDIGLGVQFVNLGHAGVAVDAARWPKLARYVAGVHARPSFAALIAEEREALGTRPA
jgi:glutathione S-transferase